MQTCLCARTAAAAAVLSSSSSSSGRGTNLTSRLRPPQAGHMLSSRRGSLQTPPTPISSTTQPSLLATLTVLLLLLSRSRAQAVTLQTTQRWLSSCKPSWIWKLAHMLGHSSTGIMTPMRLISPDSLHPLGSSLLQPVPCAGPGPCRGVQMEGRSVQAAGSRWELACGAASWVAPGALKPWASTGTLTASGGPAAACST